MWRGMGYGRRVKVWQAALVVALMLWMIPWRAIRLGAVAVFLLALLFVVPG